MESAKYKLTYFNFGGMAEKVRLTFIYNKIPFVDERIEFKDWPALKPKTKFGHVPYLVIDGKKTVAQSFAMMRYIGRLGDGSLYPTDPEKQLEVDEIIGLFQDMGRDWAPALYIGMGRHQQFGHPTEWKERGEVAKKLRISFINEKLPFYMKFFGDYLKKNGGKFLAGEKPTIADFALFT